MKKKDKCKKSEVFIKKAGCIPKEELICSWCHENLLDFAKPYYINKYVADDIKSMGHPGRGPFCEMDYHTAVMQLSQGCRNNLAKKWLNKEGQKLFKIREEAEKQGIEKLFYVDKKGLHATLPKGCKINGMIDITLNGNPEKGIRCSNITPKKNGYTNKDIVL
jgi:hypothetical protein